MQRAAIVQAAQARGDVLSRWYAEKVSGAKLARPELDALRADVRRGVVRKLYLYRLDRLTRSGIRDTLDLVQELERGGCQVVTVADGLDMTGPARDVVLSVLAWAAQVERDAIGERIRTARARIEATGGAWGRPRAMSETDVVRALELRAEGKSIRQIAMALRLKRATVQRSLARAPAAAQKPSLARAKKRPQKPRLRKTYPGATR